jgi:glycosyltransferase involved in cell wall biosynthesis
MTVSLCVVMPVFDEAPHLPATVGALADALEQSGFEGELLVVDDGSSDGSGDVAQASAGGRIPCRVIRQRRTGRFHARRAGVEAANTEWILLLDARVRLHRDALRFVAERREGAHVWNGHVVVRTEGNPFGAFGDVLVRLAWRRYFDDPRDTSYGVDDFDHYPKGTGCFFAPRRLLAEAIDAFVPRVADWRVVSDDTQLIRWIAERERIHLAPEFGCDYQPRATLRSFVGNALYRGATFLDGHGRAGSRFQPVVIAFYPVSALLAFALVRKPLLLPAVLAAAVGAGAAVAIRARRPAFDVASFAALVPLYAVAHGAGMWRGLALLARERLRLAA